VDQVTNPALPSPRNLAPAGQNTRCVATRAAPGSRRRRASDTRQGSLERNNYLRTGQKLSGAIRAALTLRSIINHSLGALVSVNTENCRLAGPRKQRVVIEMGQNPI
jgi:hypothetical protein